MPAWIRRFAGGALGRGNRKDQISQAVSVMSFLAALLSSASQISIVSRTVPSGELLSRVPQIFSILENKRSMGDVPGQHDPKCVSNVRMVSDSHNTDDDLFLEIGL